MEEQMKHRVFVYGSLRKGMYNSKYFDMEHLDTKTIEGYRMYSLGAYPYIVATGDKRDKIVVDIMEVEDDTLESINLMELGAGYQIKKEYIDGKDGFIYVKSTAREHTPLVESGDWVTYKGQET